MNVNRQEQDGDGINSSCGLVRVSIYGSMNG